MSKKRPNAQPVTSPPSTRKKSSGSKDERSSAQPMETEAAVPHLSTSPSTSTDSSSSSASRVSTGSSGSDSRGEAEATDWWTNEPWDLIVVGGGPIGLSTAYHAAKAGKRTLLLERFVLFNQSGSSNDLVRMFRTMYKEEYMAKLAHSTIQLWKDLEADAGETLILMTGLLNFGNPLYDGGPEGNLMSPIPNLELLKMPYRVLSAEEIMAEYPFKNLPSTYKGIFAPDNGCINVPLVLRSLNRLVMQYGGRIIQQAEVLRIDAQPGAHRQTVTAKIQGKTTTLTAAKVAITAGAYTNQILKPSFDMELDLHIWEMAYSYFSSKPSPNATLFNNMYFQFEVDDNKDPSLSNLFYGFPQVPWAPPNLCRIALDNAVNIITDPSQRKTEPSSVDIDRVRRFVRERTVGLDDRPNFSGSCLQTNVADNNFVLDFVKGEGSEGNKNVALFTAGWAMKFVPLIGKVLYQLLFTGKTEYDISQFSINRDKVIKTPPKSPSSVTPHASMKLTASASGGGRATGRVGEGAGAPYRTFRPLGAGRYAPPAVAAPQRAASSYVEMSSGSSGVRAASHAVQRPMTEFRSLLGKALMKQNLKEHPPTVNRRFSAVRPTTSGTTTEPVRIGIIGAGMAGLYAAFILNSLKLPAGTTVEVLEANPDRIGGRVFTRTFPAGGYIDFGAMRFPNIPTMARVIGDPKTVPFSLRAKLGADMQVQPYYLSDVDMNNLNYYNGKRLRNSELATKPPPNDPFAFGQRQGGVLDEYYVTDPYQAPDVWISTPFGKLKDLLAKASFAEGFQKVLNLDTYSTRQYLMQQCRDDQERAYTSDLVDYLETMNSATGLYDEALTESIMDRSPAHTPLAPATPSPVMGIHTEPSSLST